MAQRPKLILGSANFGPKAYGQLQEPLSLNTINLILDTARLNGITILEGAEEYHCDLVVRHPYFDLIYKVRHPYSLDKTLDLLGRDRLMGLMYHHGFTTLPQLPQPDRRISYLGASIYEEKQLTNQEQMVEVPLNLEDRRFEYTVFPVKIVRSVFGRGELLKRYTVKECLDFVKGNPTVHGVVIGVDSIAQLKQIVEIWNKD